MKGLAVLIFLGLVGTATALRTSSSKTTTLEDAVAEVGRRCAASDMNGALHVLEMYQKPIGHEQSKTLLKSCFVDKDGECTLGETQCSWMQKCLQKDGPCTTPPIKDTFNEIPGGGVALAEMNAGQTPGKSPGIPGKLGEVIAMVKEMQKKQKGKPKKKGPPKFDDYIAKVRGLKYMLWKAEGLHSKWMSYVPSQKRRTWIYQLGSIGVWFVLACGAQWGGTKMINLLGKETPVYAWFAPLGVFKNPAYTYPVLNSKIEPIFYRWNCMDGDTVSPNGGNLKKPDNKR